VLALLFTQHSNAPKGVKRDNTIALVRRTMEQGIIVAMKLCKLISSPDSEMDRGPQHAGKAGVGSKIYDLLQGKIDQGHIILYYYRNVFN
jgi:hypothetical protein